MQWALWYSAHTLLWRKELFFQLLATAGRPFTHSLLWGLYQAGPRSRLLPGQAQRWLTNLGVKGPHLQNHTQFLKILGLLPGAWCVFLCLPPRALGNLLHFCARENMPLSRPTLPCSAPDTPECPCSFSYAFRQAQLSSMTYLNTACIFNYFPCLCVPLDLHCLQVLGHLPLLWQVFSWLCLWSPIVSDTQSSESPLEMFRQILPTSTSLIIILLMKKLLD